jgi:hypothetical protein
MEEVVPELTEEKVDFISDITYPAGKVTPCGDLRVARVRQVEGN